MQTPVEDVSQPPSKVSIKTPSQASGSFLSAKSAVRFADDHVANKADGSKSNDLAGRDREPNPNDLKTSTPKPSKEFMRTLSKRKDSDDDEVKSVELSPKVSAITRPSWTASLKDVQSAKQQEGVSSAAEDKSATEETPIISQSGREYGNEEEILDMVGESSPKTLDDEQQCKEFIQSLVSSFASKSTEQPSSTQKDTDSSIMTTSPVSSEMTALTGELSGVSSLGFSFAETASSASDEYDEDEMEFMAADGFDDNLIFEKSGSETDLSAYDAEETDEPTESSISGLDTTVVPFSLLWTYGMNTRVKFMNLTEHNKPQVFFTASHEGVLYDYEKKHMTLLQGHQNAITSASMDIKGKYLVTADSGPENSIIVWRMSKCKPVCTIFNANPGSGTAILSMSPNGKYIVSVTSDMPAIIKLWVWSSGSDQPVDTYLTIPAYGKPIGVVFNLTVQERFMVTFKRQIVFMKYHIAEKRFIEPRIPEFRNKSKLGKITDSCYLLLCHDCFASTTEGFVIVLGNTYYKKEFNIDEEYDARKIFITAVKVTSTRLNTISSCDGIIVTGDARGHIKFYDRYVRLLYWCQNFKLPGVHKISFNRDPRKYKLAPPIKRSSKDRLETTIRIDRRLDSNDLSEQYEILYKNMVPQDATLKRLPFIVRDFIVATDDGNMVKIDYIRNDCEQLLVTAETPVAGIDVHEDMPYLVIAYRNGRISLYDYMTHNMVHSAVLPPMIVDQTQPGTSQQAPVDEKSSDYLLTKSVTCIKFSPKCYQLAVGRGNGELFFLEPVLLHAKPGYPVKRGNNPIMKLIFSADFKYFAYYDKNRTVYLFYYDIEKDQWFMIGKNRSHTKELTDLMFSPFSPPELYSIGLDKYLVKYDISNSITDLVILSRRRIDQTATPNCLIFYPLLDQNHFLIADDQFKLKILNPETALYRHVFLGPAYGCYSEAPIRTMSMLPNPPNSYLIFSTKRHIGIQKLPPDGNPYKYTGTIGHPYKMHQYTVSSCGKYIFTAGRRDACVLMWQINYDAVDNLERVGGKEIHPYFCLIEGGHDGWLFQEMENLFYYMQILHQGENTQLPRVVSEYIALSELPDLMRACGYYPTEFEIERMLNDVMSRNKDRGHAENDISFRDFVVLYINHRPAHGVSMEKLQGAFYQICDSYDGDNNIDTEDLMEVLCAKGESFSQEALLKCMSILMNFSQDQDAQHRDDTSTITPSLPEVIDFDVFVHDILGIDMKRSAG